MCSFINLKRKCTFCPRGIGLKSITLFLVPTLKAINSKKGMSEHQKESIFLIIKNQIVHFIKLFIFRIQTKQTNVEPG